MKRHLRSDAPAPTRPAGRRHSHCRPGPASGGSIQSLFEAILLALLGGLAAPIIATRRARLPAMASDLQLCAG
jgi:hypothetical protein